MALNSNSLEWPTPPYFSFGHGDDKALPEACLIYYTNGIKALGMLVRFSQEDTSIVFHSNQKQSAETINLEEIKSIRLLRTLMLRKDTTLLEERAEEIFPASERQPYTLEFTDKEVMSGKTISYTNTKNGLFLFLPNDEEKIARCFFPRQSIKDFQIGLRIGQLLIEESLADKDAVDTALSLQQHLQGQRLGDYLEENQIVTREQLALAIQHQENQPILKLGEALIQLDLITEEQLNAALEKQRGNRKLQLGQILVEMEVIDERTLKGALAKKLGIPYLSLTNFNFDLDAIKLVDVGLARAQTLVPICTYQNSLVVAFENPLNMKAIEDLRFLTQMKIVPAMASGEDIKEAIFKYYGASSALSYSDSLGSDNGYAQSEVANLKIDDLATKLFGEDKENNAEIALEPIAESDNTLVQLVNKMILDAFQDGVSDIHIETYAGKQNTRIRFRKDGSLIPYLEIPSNFRNAMISRIKIMAQLDISERRKPQDGKLDFQNFGPAKVELRVATIPTTNGLEDVVMRVLASAKPVLIDNLGLAPDILDNLKRLIARPYGLLLVCGPTGSGKTTTLHSLVGYINKPERKIWTAEDPVEITQDGLRQVQVNAKIGWTFAGAMRSFLRADPDVIMVGEMRDEETTRIGIEASLTGHLVLSTLHTNSAPESVVRLLDLGMDPFNFADALLAILAQRLAKTLCSKCKQSYIVDDTELEELALEFVSGTNLDPQTIRKEWQSEYAKDGAITMYKAVGCKDCSKTGYRGRLGLHELMTVTPPIRHLIQTRAPVSQLLPAAVDAGMHTLKQDGISKVLKGLTDISQVRAVCA